MYTFPLGILVQFKMSTTSPSEKGGKAFPSYILNCLPTLNKLNCAAAGKHNYHVQPLLPLLPIFLYTSHSSHNTYLHPCFSSFLRFYFTLIICNVISLRGKHVNAFFSCPKVSRVPFVFGQVRFQEILAITCYI